MLAVFGPLAVAYAYSFSRHNKQESHTIAFNTAIYAYLLAYGFGVLVACIEVTFNNYEIGIGSWLLGPIHLVPALTMLLFRERIFRWLGSRWLSGRRGFNAREIGLEQGIKPHHGSLAAVEDAISAGRDLNAPLQLEGAHDEFTLLLLACFNGHLDAANRLLDAEAMVNKASPHQQWRPLYVAAMNGHSDVVASLLFRGADAHAQTEAGENALLVATAHGHTQVVKQLLDVGAELEMQWMGLTAADAAAHLQRDSALCALRAYESHFAGRISEARGVNCVASWPGMYAREWDRLMAQVKEGADLGAAVVRR